MIAKWLDQKSLPRLKTTSLKVSLVLFPRNRTWFSVEKKKTVNLTHWLILKKATINERKHKKRIDRSIGKFFFDRDNYDEGDESYDESTE